MGKNETISRRRRHLLALAATAVALGAPVANAAGESPQVREARQPSQTRGGGSEEITVVSEKLQETKTVSITTISAPQYPLPFLVRREDGSFRVSFPGTNIQDYILTVPPQLSLIPRSTRTNPRSAAVDFIGEQGTGELGVLVGGWIKSPSGTLIPTSFTIVDEDYRYPNSKELREIPKLHFQITMTPKRRSIRGLFTGSERRCTATITFMDGQRLADDERVKTPAEHNVGPVDGCAPWVVSTFQADIQVVPDPHVTQPISPHREDVRGQNYGDDTSIAN